MDGERDASNARASDLRERATIVYRGQLTVERSRIEFLLAAACRAFDEVDLVMLSPGMGATAEEFEEFARSYANVRDCTFLASGRWRRRGVRRELRRVIAADAHRAVGVGFSVASYLPKRSLRVWCVNGIPEERLLHRRALSDRAAVSIAWRAARRCRFDLTVVVSDPMARLVTDRTGGVTFVVPNAVDRSTFRFDPTVVPKYLTYLGGGSPWQGLDRLAELWSELHRLDPALRFRVITRDPRAHLLVDAVPSSVVDVQSADDPRVVAAHLQEARLGFLVREPNLVNQVSWPMKMGEYLAAGAPVVVTRCGWDAERLVERHGAGVIVSWDAPPECTARRIVEYLGELGPRRPSGVEAAAAELDDRLWLDRLARAMRRASAALDREATSP